MNTCPQTAEDRVHHLTVFVLSPYRPLLPPLGTWGQKQSPLEGGAENLSSGLLV